MKVRVVYAKTEYASVEVDIDVDSPEFREWNEESEVDATVLQDWLESDGDPWEPPAYVRPRPEGEDEYKIERVVIE